MKGNTMNNDNDAFEKLRAMLRKRDDIFCACIDLSRSDSGISHETFSSLEGALRKLEIAIDAAIDEATAPPKTYNHAFTIGFAVDGSSHPTGEDITPERLLTAIINRANQAYADGELKEAVGLPYDTYEE